MEENRVRRPTFTVLLIAAISIGGSVRMVSGQATCRFDPYPNQNIAGGSNDCPAKTLTACQFACTTTPGCLGIDWQASSSTCWLQFTTQIKETYNGITHYDYVCSNQCRFDTYLGYSAPGGGTYNAASSLTACQTACEATALCWSINWQASNSTCWLLTMTQEKSPTPGIDNYDYICPDICMFNLSANTYISGGMYQSAITSLSACQLACTTFSACRSIDWLASNSSCWLFETQGGQTAYSGMSHYDYECQDRCIFVAYTNTNIPGSTFYLQQTLTGCQDTCASTNNCQGFDWQSSNSTCWLSFTRAGKATSSVTIHYDYYCLPQCHYLLYSNTTINGAVALSGVTTLGSCITACSYNYSTSGCQGVTWQASTSTCGLLYTQQGAVPSSGVLLYEYLCPSQCSFVWYPNNTIASGTLSSGVTTLNGCLNACVTSSGCQGVNWEAIPPTCTTLTTQSGKMISVGTDHYDYVCVA